jgi:hypothetical protein
MGKGSKRRESSITDEELEQNWHRIFRRNDKNAEKSRYNKKPKEKCNRT